MSEVFIEGLGTTVVGMLTVFAVLIMLSFVLYLLKFVNKDIKKTEIVEDKVIETKEQMPVEPIVQEDVDDLELIAVITAAIASSLNTNSDRLQVKSIVRVNNWNTVARKEQQRNIF